MVTIFRIERKERVYILRHAAKQYPQRHGVTSQPCRLSSIEGTYKLNTAILHTTILGLCQVRKVGIILVSILLGELCHETLTSERSRTRKGLYDE
jgi:hypothetical protein